MQNPAEEFEQIDIHQAKEIMDQKNAIIVDVRRPEAYHEARIKGAVLVTDENVEEFLNTADKTKSLLCYCYHGFSSRNAAAFFKQSGFQDVYSIIGGFEQWKTAYPVDKNNE